MIKSRFKLFGFASLLGFLVFAPPATVPTDAQAQFFGRNQQASAQASAEQRARQAAREGVVIGKAYSPSEALRQSRLLNAALGKLKPERRGVTDAFVVVAGLDSDAVFGREAAEAGRVLSRRFDADGHTIVVANGTGANDRNVPDGNPNHLAAALAQVGELMNKDEDVLVLYLTAHGHWVTGVAYRDGERAAGNIAPSRLAAMLDDAGIKNRLVIVSACYSGIFIPALQNETTVTMTAASSEKPSFGCRAENDWTFFGDALINNAMRQPAPSADAFAAARVLISQWETAERLSPSNPQVDIGLNAGKWLDRLDARVPRTATPRVGRPANAPVDAPTAKAATPIGPPKT
jgi:Peptidase C13 family